MSFAASFLRSLYAAILLWAVVGLLGAGAKICLSRLSGVQAAGASSMKTMSSPIQTAPDPTADTTIIGMRALFVRIVAHNIFVYVLLLLGLVSWGIPTVLATANNAWSLGWTIASALANGMRPSTIAVLILPHGILEIAGFVLGTAVGFQGLRYGVLALRGQLRPTPSVVRGLMVWSVAGMLLLIVAAIVESSITRELVVRYRMASSL